MSDKTLVEKLQIKPGRSFLLVNPLAGYEADLGPLPNDVTLLRASDHPVDIIQVFVVNREEMEKYLPSLKYLLAPNGILWVTYFKGTARIKTDINRDSINAYAKSLGMQGVAMISIDQDWSALRLKKL